MMWGRVKTYLSAAALGIAVLSAAYGIGRRRGVVDTNAGRDARDARDTTATIRRVHDATTGDRGGVDGAAERMRARQGRDR